MALSLDNLAHRYNCLPSEALARATTFDLYVLDISAKYSKYQQDKAAGNTASSARKPSKEEMIDMIKRVRGK